MTADELKALAAAHDIVVTDAEAADLVVGYGHLAKLVAVVRDVDPLAIDPATIFAFASKPE